jgi:hypothetical protein
MYVSFSFFSGSVFPEYKTISGSRAELPCNVTMPSSDDAITLILWYRGNASRTPIYSVDAREELLSNATHFRGDIFAGNRASFDLSVRPALLKIDPVLEVILPKDINSSSLEI